MSVRFTGTLCALLALAVAAPRLLPAQQAIITIANPKVFGDLSRPPVRFTHADHMAIEGVSCLTCHHVFVKGKNVLEAKDIKAGDPALSCASCHAGPADLEKSFHLLCITCHDTAKRQGKVTGPRECGLCHGGGR
jgi:hypothetical protein